MISYVLSLVAVVVHESGGKLHLSVAAGRIALIYT